MHKRYAQYMQFRQFCTVEIDRERTECKTYDDAYKGIMMWVRLMAADERLSTARAWVEEQVAQHLTGRDYDDVMRLWGRQDALNDLDKWFADNPLV